MACKDSIIETIGWLCAGCNLHHHWYYRASPTLTLARRWRLKPTVNLNNSCCLTGSRGVLGGEMCGIAVAIKCDGAETAVRRLIAGMLHRGDVTDPLVTVGNNVAMCTRRLRIVDAAHGVQPQASSDGRFLVSLNGEIYNHVALRQ
jgi:hypothetical protein